MRFYGTFRDEEFLGDFVVRQSGGDQLQHFIFSGADTQLRNPGGIDIFWWRFVFYFGFLDHPAGKITKSQKKQREQRNGSFVCKTPQKQGIFTQLQQKHQRQGQQAKLYDYLFQF